MAITRQQRTKNSADANTGRYTQGGLVDRYNNRLGWWERFQLEKQADDIQFNITIEYVGRPDLIAYRLYKKATLAWLVLQYNNIVDINTELVVGATLLLPTPRRVQTSILSNTTGGNIVNKR